MRSLLLLGCVLLPLSAFAQPIHGHPQKAAYASPAEWPTPSAQCHWSRPGIATAHTHVDLTLPLCAELSGPVVIPFKVTLFQTAGHVGVVYHGVFRGASGRDVVWDETGTSTMPVFNGDPNGVVIKTGHLTLDPPSTYHGLFFAVFVVYTYFDNGDVTNEALYAPLYSTVNLDTPLSDETVPVLSSRCVPDSAVNDINYGEITIQYREPVPIAPISAVWPSTVAAYSYGGAIAGFLDATYEQRMDADRHNGIPGVLLQTLTAPAMDDQPAPFDPAVMGAGTHKMAQMWSQPNGDELVTSLIVLNVTVGDSTPTTCTDPTATNVNGPLPCTYPPPPDWVTVSSVLQRLGDVIRLCLADGKCLVLGSVQ